MRIALAAVLLAGCAGGMSFSEVRTYCDRNSTNFPQYAGCLRQVIASDAVPDRARSSQRTQLFLAYTDALAARVRAGRLGDQEARAEAELTRQQMLADARREDDADLAFWVRYLQASQRPTSTTCTRISTTSFRCD